MMIHLKKYVLCTNNWYSLAQIYEEKKSWKWIVISIFINSVQLCFKVVQEKKRMMIHLKKYVAYSNNWYFLAQIFEDKKIDNEFVVCMKRQTMTNPFFCMGSRFVVWVFFLRRLMMVQVDNFQRVLFLYHFVEDFEQRFSCVEFVKTFYKMVKIGTKN